MNRKMYAAGVGAIACLLTSTAAFAADATRSSAALPAPAAQSTLAPTNGVRTATKLEKKSKAIGRSEMIGLGIVGAVVVGGIIVVATQDDEPDSAG